MAPCIGRLRDELLNREILDTLLEADPTAPDAVLHCTPGANREGVPPASARRLRDTINIDGTMERSYNQASRHLLGRGLWFKKRSRRLGRVTRSGLGQMARSGFTKQWGAVIRVPSGL